MSVEWFVLRGEQSEGPLSSSELKFLADQRQITPETLVKQGSSGSWVAAGTIEGLFVEYHGARPAPSTGTPPPVRYVKPRESKPDVARPGKFAEPPTVSSAHRSGSPLPSHPPSHRPEEIGPLGPSQTQRKSPPDARSPAQEPVRSAQETFPTPMRMEAKTAGEIPTRPLTSQGAGPPAASSEPSAEEPSAVWYLRTPDGQQYGPINKAQLDQWVAEGRIGHDCWLWRSGWANWELASTVYIQLGQPLEGVAPPSVGTASSIGTEPSGKTAGSAAAWSSPSPGGRASIEAETALGDPQRWIGQTLGRYQLVEYIGRGPSGLVYKARHAALDRWVAVRLVPTVADRQLFEQLSQGLRAAVRLSHPHIVEVHDMGESGGMVYLAMELMEGGSLADWIRRTGRVPPSAALAIFHQVVSALAAAHAAGLLHQDIKPSNILFTGQGVAKLSDLGLAALSAARLRSGSGSVSSIAYYTAPEIFRGQPADARSDLYSLGATFYHALTGYMPGEGIPVEELFRRRGEIPLRSITTWVADLPPPIGAMIDRLLLPDPSLRFSSAAELLGMLQSVVSGPTAPTPLPARTAAGPGSISQSPGVPLPSPSGTVSPEGEAAGWFTKVLHRWQSMSWKGRLVVGLVGLLALIILGGLLWGLTMGWGSPDVPGDQSAPPSAESSA